MSQSTKSLLIYGAIILFTIAPFISLIVSAAIAAFSGCRIDINKPQPCMAFGRDIGRLLTDTFFMSGLLLVITVPVGGIALVVYTLILRKSH